MEYRMFDVTLGDQAHPKIKCGNRRLVISMPTGVGAKWLTLICLANGRRARMRLSVWEGIKVKAEIPVAHEELARLVRRSEREAAAIVKGREAAKAEMARFTSLPDLSTIDLEEEE